MFREDYIIRLIKQLADFVARIAGYRQKGEFERAQAEIERARDELLGLPPGLIDVVDTPTLVGLLRHPDKMRGAARLFWEEGLVLRARRDPLTAAARFRRAFELYLEARAIDPSEDDTSAILELSRLVPAGELDERYRT
ncbi:MAG TPA: hypothetical protein VFU21_20505 [Kofleriaceae bacterium]|nr:hypothetical protein [Kofleriaceae bacterium]